MCTFLFLTSFTRADVPLWKGGRIPGGEVICRTELHRLSAGCRLPNTRPGRMRGGLCHRPKVNLLKAQHWFSRTAPVSKWRPKCPASVIKTEIGCLGFQCKTKSHEHSARIVIKSQRYRDASQLFKWRCKTGPYYGEDWLCSKCRLLPPMGDKGTASWQCKIIL